MNDLAPTISPLEFLDALRTRSRVGLCVVDATLGYIWVNDALADMLGYDADELVGMSVGDVTHAETGNSLGGFATVIPIAV